jgi:tetratricopeptide (TPR) repeat protein
MTELGPDTPPSNESFSRAPSKSENGAYSRERILFAYLVSLAVFFAMTAFVARRYHKKVHTLADQWSAKGDSAFQQGDAARALGDYRNALVYSPNNTVFQFHLAQALAAAGHKDEAQSYFLSLLSESPGSGQINLALARIAAGQRATSEAIRYYQDAIYGVWESNPLEMRWQVRRELSEYLLDLGANQEAQPELIALGQEVAPRNIAEGKAAGALLLRAQLWAPAFDVFRSILESNGHDDDALAGAGKAAFELGRYSETVQYLNQLPREKRQSADISALLETSESVDAIDPFLPGLSISEQAERTAKALDVAGTRLASCAEKRGEEVSQTPPVTDAQKLFVAQRSAGPDWSRSSLERHPERISSAMSLAFQMEEAAWAECGAPQNGVDRALMLMAKGRGGANP